MLLPKQEIQTTCGKNNHGLKVASSSKWHPFFRLRMSGIMGRPPVYIIYSLGYEIMRKYTLGDAWGMKYAPKLSPWKVGKSGKHTPKSSLLRIPGA